MRVISMPGGRVRPVADRVARPQCLQQELDGVGAPIVAEQDRRLVALEAERRLA